MKKFFVSALAAVTLLACTPKQDAYTQFKEMDQSIREQLAGASIEQRDSLINAYAENGYELIMNNLKDHSVDSIVAEICYMFSAEQKAALFAAIPQNRLDSPLLAPIYDKYQKEMLTSAGQPYIDVASLKADGTVVALSELVGKTDYLLVDFWASWCGPCRRSMPLLKELYATYAPSGKLQIIGISCDRDEAAWLAAIEEDQLPWVHIRDQRTEQYNPCVQYGISGIPTTVLINSDGIIVARNPSEEEIKELLNK